MTARRDKERPDSATVRELAEQVREIAWRVQSIPPVSRVGFRLLCEREQAELLHELSHVRRWAEMTLRKLAQAEDEGLPFHLEDATRKEDTR